MTEAPKSNLVIHSGKLPHNVETERKNFYETSEGKKTIADGLQHQSNISADANDINRQAHAEGRGPNNEEIGGFLDRTENKHAHRPLIKKVSRSSSSVGTWGVRKGKYGPINQRAVEMETKPSKRIKPAWKR